MSNKKEYIIQIKNLLHDPENEIWENHYEDTQKSLFDLLKEEDQEVR